MALYYKCIIGKQKYIVTIADIWSWLMRYYYFYINNQARRIMLHLGTTKSSWSWTVSLLAQNKCTLSAEITCQVPGHGYKLYRNSTDYRAIYLDTMMALTGNVHDRVWNETASKLCDEVKLYLCISLCYSVPMITLQKFTTVRLFFCHINTILFPS